MDIPIPSQELPPLKALRAFEAAGRHRSITRAAEELNVTPGAVSRQVKLLEEWLGVALLIRSHRQINLTDTGRHYIAEISKALSLITHATRPLIKAARSRPLRICSYPTFTQRWLIARWKEFSRQHPHIDFEFSTSLSPMDEPVDSFDALVCLGHHAEPWEGWVALHLYRIEMVPVCSPDLLAAHGGTISLKDLSKFSLIRGAPRPDDWARWLNDNHITGVASDNGPIFENFNLATQAAIESAGILLADRVLASDELATGRLVQPFGPVRRTQNSFYLIFPHHNATDGRLMIFSNWLKDQVSDGK